MDAAPRRMSTEARREQLLAFGRQHFAEHGYEAMSMDAIAQRAGVSKGLFYHYFGNQRAFYMETVRSVTDELIEITEPPADRAFGDAFQAMVTAFVGYVAHNGGIYTALVRGGLGSDDEVNALLDRVRVISMDRILERLGIERPSELSRLSIYGWVSFVENASAEWTSKRDVSTHQLVDLFIAAFAPVFDILQRERCS